MADIDRFELLRSGAARQPGDLLGDIAVPDALLDGAGVIEVVDSEGVPLARVEIAGDAAGRRVVSGIETWLSPRSSRPFERLHRAPAEFSSAAPVLLVDASSDIAEVRAAAAATPRLRVVFVGSVAGDGSGVVTRAVRRIESELERTGSDLVIVAADPTWHGVVDQVGIAFAHGGVVTSMLGGQPEQEPPRGVVLLLSGLSGSGKSTIAKAVRDHLVETTDAAITLLDGDEVRRHLSAGLGFGVADRETNVRRIGWVAAEIAHHGGLVICSPIAPFERTRSDVRRYVEERGCRFVLVHVATPLAECERRDRKGLYARARAGAIPEFTGISSPYEEPTDADLVVDTTDLSIGDARDRVLELIQPERTGDR